MSINSAAAYRADFVLRLFRSFLEVSLGFITIQIFFGTAPQIAGWTNMQALLVYAFAFFVGSMVKLFTGSGVEGLHREIVNGTLDRILIQPVDSQWLASTRFFYVTNIFRTLFNLGLTLWVLHQLAITWTVFKMLLVSLNLLSAMIIYYSILFTGATVSFWALNGELYYLLSNITSIVNYPLDIFPKSIKTVLTIIPLIFIATIPAQIVINKPTFLQYLAFPISLVVLYLCRQFWYFGLRSYQSASS